MKSTLRIVSLLPSATEIVCALGAEPFLVGRSHECDFPASVKTLSVVSRPRTKLLRDAGHFSTIEVHREVVELLTQSLSVFEVDVPALKALQPTHILTQSLCDVCAIDREELEHTLRSQPWAEQCRVIDLSPTTFEGVLESVREIATAIHREEESESLLAQLSTRIHASTQSVTTPPKVACIEWYDPLMVAGNWVPELVSLAGGCDVLGKPGEHSPWIDPQKLVEAAPEILVLMPCGYSLADTLRHAKELICKPWWKEIPAVTHGRVYAVDGNQYFNRPGPRLVDSLEILTNVFASRPEPRAVILSEQTCEKSFCSRA